MPAPDGWSVFPDQGAFLEQVGPVLLRDGDDELVLALQTEDRHANRRGTVMGGLLSTLADFAIGRAIDREDEDDQARATVSLTVDYLKPVKPGERVHTRTSVDRVGGTVAFADCSLWVGEREVARARGVFAAT